MEYQDCGVDVNFGTKENPRVVTRTYKQIVKASVTVDDMLRALSEEKSAKELINNWHYGVDLKAKSEVRNAIISEDAGPEKAFEKSVKDFMKLRESVGKPVSEEKARAFVKMTMEADMDSVAA